MSEPNCPRCGAESRAPYDPAFSGKVWWCESTDSALGFSQGYACVCRERDKFRAMLDEYPKTADGVTITPGMELFEPWRTAHDGVRTFCVKCWYDAEEDMELPHGEVYSTRKAAEAAKENE